MNEYSETSRKNHRSTILALSGWKIPGKTEAEQLEAQAQWYIEQQHSPKKILGALVRHCETQQWVIPSYSQLTDYITVHFNGYEDKLLRQLAQSLTTTQTNALEQLFFSENPQSTLPRPLITTLKSISQSVKPGEIQKSVALFNQVKGYHFGFGTLTDSLALTDQATEYFATWVEKAQTFQLTNFSNRHKAYLYMLAYLKHQFYLRQDTLIDICLKSILSTQSQLKSELQKLEQAEQSTRNQAIKTVSKTSKDLKHFAQQVIQIVSHAPLSETEKIRQLEALIEDHLKSYDEKEHRRISDMEAFLDRAAGTDRYFDVLESLSLRLQQRVSGIVKSLDFSHRSSNRKLLAAIEHFTITDGKLDAMAPMGFLSSEEHEAICCDDQFRVSLYKALLFIHIAKAIKSGQLIFDATYRYKGIFDYLIGEQFWRDNREELLKSAGLEDFSDVESVLKQLRVKLGKKYCDVNERLLNDENPLVGVDAKGKPTVKTPKIDNNEYAVIGDTLLKNGYVPIQQVLADVNQVCDFKSGFTHYANKHDKMRPTTELILAGILGKGCNLGLSKIANISVGISEDILKNTVTWFFELKNLQAANHKIVAYIDKLSLANAYRSDPQALFTSSDGQKYYVAVDSLNSAYSFKYFGSDQGATIYTFLDERQALFYSTVISASEREAAYVIDGLTHNDAIKSDIHATDTHGYTELIFGATHFMGTAFAPRIKKVGRQSLYDFEARKSHTKKGHILKPSDVIRKKLIIDNWEDILRFMVTIKLKKATASQLFTRLSSYAKTNPLYKGLKEFGRILKSYFILTYFDDMALRQKIEKQLNRVELSNKFAKAIFFANNQELQEGLKAEQDIAGACKMLIQNSIVLWNYLYLSEYLAGIADQEERTAAVQSILNGSVLTWRHINLHGEYDFTRDAANEPSFNLDKILALSVVN